MNTKQMVAWIIGMAVGVLFLINFILSTVGVRTGTREMRDQVLAEEIVNYVSTRSIGALIIELLVTALLTGLFVYLLRDKKGTKATVGQEP